MEAPPAAEQSVATGRDAILESIAFAAERLLLATDWRAVAEEVLGRLAVAAGVARAYIVRTGMNRSGQLTSTWLFEWDEPGVVRVMDDPNFQTTEWAGSGFGRWAEMLREGDVVHGAVREFPASERVALESHGVVSLASFPVFVEGGWWGAIGFDDTARERSWRGPEYDALPPAATRIAADGRIVCVHDTSTEVRDENGLTLYFQGFLIDTTQRRLAEERLRESEDRYRNLVDHSPNAILVHQGGRFVYANPAAANLLGANDPSRLLGMDVQAIVHPDYRAVVRSRIAAEAEGEIAPLLEEVFVRLDGSEIIV